MTDLQILVFSRRPAAVAFQVSALLGAASLLTLAVACGNRPTGSELHELPQTVSATLSAEEFCAAWTQRSGAREDSAASQVTKTAQTSVEPATQQLAEEPDPCSPCAENTPSTPPAPPRPPSAPPTSKKAASGSELQRIF